MSRKGFLRTSRRFLAALPIVLAAARLDPAAAAASKEPGAIAPEVRRDLEAALKAKVAAVLDEKDPTGASFKRASYSKSFHRVGDDVYETGFHLETAGKDRLLTQRYVVTLKKDAGGRKWVVASEELRDSYDGLTRSVPGAEDFQLFDRFLFDREGIKAGAGAGSLVRYSRDGKVEGFFLMGSDLTYHYAPPLKQDLQLYGRLLKEKAELLQFAPESFFLSCDPVSCGQILASSFSGLRSASKEEIGSALRERYDLRLKEVLDGRKENAFAGFARPYEAEDRAWSIAVKKKNLDHWLALDCDNREPREVTFWVSSLGVIYTYPSEATRGSGLSPYDLERRDDFSGRDYDLETLAGTVDLGFGDGELLTGEITFGLRTKKDLRVLPFRIATIREFGSQKKETKNPRMTLNSIQDQSGRELTWVKTGPVSGLVVFPEMIPAGSAVTLRMDFENRDCIYKLTSSYSYVSRGGWLPFVRFGDFIKEFDLTVKVPAKYRALGIGKKVAGSVAGGVETTRWVSDSPVDFPTVIFGDYVESPSRVAAKRADGTEIPVTIHVDRISMGQWEIAPKALPALADEAANALNLYREIFGVDYPYSKLDLVNDPLGFLYGQAPSSIVYLGSGGFWSKGILGTIGGADLTKFSGSLVAHEVGHQWWGSSTSNANDRSYWFVESLAEYASSLYVEAVNGKKAYLEHVNDWRREILSTDLQVSVQDASVQWTGSEFAGYRAAVYAKGPYAFHIMRTTWGDEKLYAFLKMLAQDLKGKEIVTRDIQKVAEKAYGAPMEWFFDQWIRGVGMPHYTLTYHESVAEDGSTIIEGEVEQKVVVGMKKDVLEGEFYEALVPITVVGRSGKEYQKKLVVKGPSTSFRFKIPEPSKEVALNKYGEVLADDVVAHRGT